MSIAIMNEAHLTDLRGVERWTLLALADSANDQDDGRTWIPIKSRQRFHASGRPKMDLMHKVGAGERAIQNAIKSLVEKGHITRKESPGRGVEYWVHPVVPQAADTPAANAGVQQMRPAPDTGTPAANAPDPRSKCTQTLSKPKQPARARGARGGLGKMPAPAARPFSPLPPVPEQVLEAHREQVIRQAIERALSGQVPPWLARAGLKCGDLSDDGQVVGLTVIVPLGQRDAVERATGSLMEIANRDTSLTVRWVNVETTRAKQAA